MKKRAQLPDAYTFTTLFRGFSLYPHYPQSLPRAISIYRSMFAEKCPVKPSIIHTNAVLKVCALAHDVDSLLDIAAKLPTRGNGAPNNLTYTIILNAIRNQAWEETESMETYPVKKERKIQAVLQGRKVWEEVKQRWTEGDLFLDEELVCAMGRLLLLGDLQDCDAILSLLEQTMGLPRQVPRMSNLGRERRASENSRRIQDLEHSIRTSSSDDILTESRITSNPQTLSATDNGSNQISDPFSPLPSRSSIGSQAHIRPGRNTLSLVVDACVRLSFIRAAQNYWGVLTSPTGAYKITPDNENYHMYLRLLRVQRASKLAVELVQEMRQGELAGKQPLHIKTFRIALSCCVRDIRNKNSVAHAAKLVKIMSDDLPYPDAKALSMYLDVALSQRPCDWRVLMGVIRTTEPGVRNLRSLLAYDPAGETKQDWGDVLKLVRDLIGALDVVLDLGNEGMSQAEKKWCNDLKYPLSRYFSKSTSRRVLLKAEDAKRGTGEEYGGTRKGPSPALTGIQRAGGGAGDEAGGGYDEDVAWEDEDGEKKRSVLGLRRMHKQRLALARGDRKAY